MSMEKFLETEISDIPEKIVSFLIRYKVLVVILILICVGLLILFAHGAAPNNVVVTGDPSQSCPKTPDRPGNEIGAAIVNTMFIIFCILVDALLFVIAFVKVRKIDRDNPCASGMQKLSVLNATDIYFDLPLYFGLFGTVMGFLLMEWFPSVSRTVAYLTTLGGILVSSALRVFVETPRKERWTKEDNTRS